MKPRIVAYRTKYGVRKWRCISEFSAFNGPAIREGTGYTPREAYNRWLRFGHFAKPAHLFDYLIGEPSPGWPWAAK